MIKDTIIEILDTPEYGIILKCLDLELADEFDDYLSENCFVLFNLKFDPKDVSFIFGQASSELKVRELFEKFISEKDKSMHKAE